MSSNPLTKRLLIVVTALRPSCFVETNQFKEASISRVLCRRRRDNCSLLLFHYNDFEAPFII